MIVVAGFNTAIDVRVDVAALRPGRTHRSSEPIRLPGGKGLHVAQTAAALGAAVRLVGLVDAAHQEAIRRRLHDRGVAFDGIEAERLRECWTIRERDGRCSEFLQPGPRLAPAQVRRLRDALLQAADGCTLAVLSGSLPPGCDRTLYAELIGALQARGVRCLVDTSGDALADALDARPFLAKPNRHEAAELLQRPIGDVDDALSALAALRARGAATPLLTLGAEGALLADGDRVLRGRLPIDRTRNPVGSGDCLLAGVAVALARGEDASAALRLGLACGAANAAALEPGFADPRQVRALLPLARIDTAPPTPQAIGPRP